MASRICSAPEAKYFQKSMGLQELETHRLVNELLPGVSPSVRTITAQGQRYLVTMDLGLPVSGGVSLDVLLRHARLLARVHDAFESHVAQLTDLGYRHIERTLTVDPIALIDSCLLLRCLLGDQIDATHLDVLRRAANSGAFEPTWSPSSPMTLVHGDSHQENLVYSQEGRLQLVDWGSAMLESGLLDLVFMPPVAVEAYREELGRLGNPLPNAPSFNSDLRKAKVFRQFDLLCHCVTSVLVGPDSVTQAQFARALPELIGQLAVAVVEADRPGAPLA